MHCNLVYVVTSDVPETLDKDVIIWYALIIHWLFGLLEIDAEYMYVNGYNLEINVGYAYICSRIQIRKIIEECTVMMAKQHAL